MNAHRHCMLIDNDEDDREVFGMAILEADQSASCSLVSSGLEALKQLQADPSFVPSYFFIDMNMPLMNGKECLAQLKQIQHLQHVPMYMYSTASDPRSIEEVKQLGAAALIIKPNTYQELVGLLRALIRPSIEN